MSEELRREQCLAIVRSRLFGMFYLQGSIEDYKGMTDGQVEAFFKSYDEHFREEVIAALQWVASEPQVQLAGVLPALSRSEEEMRTYLARELSSLLPPN